MTENSAKQRGLATTGKFVLISPGRNSLVSNSMRSARLIIAIGAASVVASVAIASESAGVRINDDTVALLKTFRQEFILISPGKGRFPTQFSMGSGDRGPAAERPVHVVVFSYNFSMAKYEVPQNLWTAVMNSDPSQQFSTRSFSKDS